MSTPSGKTTITEGETGAYTYRITASGMDNVEGSVDFTVYVADQDCSGSIEYTGVDTQVGGVYQVDLSDEDTYFDLSKISATYGDETGVPSSAISVAVYDSDGEQVSDLSEPGGFAVVVTVEYTDEDPDTYYAGTKTFKIPVSYGEQMGSVARACPVCKEAGALRRPRPLSFAWGAEGEASVGQVSARGGHGNSLGSNWLQRRYPDRSSRCSPGQPRNPAIVCGRVAHVVGAVVGVVGYGMVVLALVGEGDVPLVHGSVGDPHRAGADAGDVGLAAALGGVGVVDGRDDRVGPWPGEVRDDLPPASQAATVAPEEGIEVMPSPRVAAAAPRSRRVASEAPGSTS